MPLDQTTVTRVDIWPLDVPLTDPFVVATGTKTTADNLFVRVTLRSGAVGYGEIAPFPEVGGADREAARRAAVRLTQAVLGRSAADWRDTAPTFGEGSVPGAPTPDAAARCGIETALLDAWCRTRRTSVWHALGAADVRPRETDITIPIAGVDRSVALARGWHARGFRLFKTKVGADVGEDIRRLEAIHRACPGARFIADANQGFSLPTCRAFLAALRRIGVPLELLEQPVPRDDWEGMAALVRDGSVPVAADESARSLADVREIVARRAADVINIKIMKCGVSEALEIAAAGRAAGLRLMIGGMVETRVAMGCSFGLVLGLGGFDFLDLDTPLLLAADPVSGGYRYEGPQLVPWTGPGLGLELPLPVSPADVTTLA